jgi:spore germination protein KC
MLGKSNVKIKPWICGIVIFFMLFITGCWDRIEANDLALIVASAFDRAPDGKVQMTVQVMLPSGGGPGGGPGGGSQQGKKFIVETATGNDPEDAEQIIQKMVSRRLFKGQRRVIIIGEEMARYGVGEVLDYISREPENRLRTNILVVKSGTGSDLLKVEFPLERFPAEAMREMINSGLGEEVTIRDFLIKASIEGIQPIAAAIEMKNGQKGLQLTGFAIFKGLKLAGYLNAEETSGYLWATGRFKKGIVTTKVPGNEGTIDIDVRNATTKVTPEIDGNKVNIFVEIKGEGVIYGNSTKLDLTVPKNIALIEKAFETEIEKQVEKTIKVVQKKYGADIFGFGSTIYGHNPKEWKRLREKWDKVFPDAEVSVSTDFNIRMTGMAGPSLYLKENEVKK